MRVTIAHREVAGGVTGQRRTYFVDCVVAFSEEERAVIKARDLFDHDIVVRAAIPLPSQSAIAGTNAMVSIGALLATFGPIVGVVGGLAKISGSEGLGVFMLIGGIALYVSGRRRSRREDHRLIQNEQSVKIRQLMSNPQFTVHALDPAHAKQVDEDVRAQLAALKEMIRGSTELQSTQTFEL